MSEPSRKQAWIDSLLEAADAFVAGYAKRSGVTPGWLAEHGRVVVSCKCGAAECEGWAVVSCRFVDETRADGVTDIGGTDYSQIYWPRDQA
jgi:hypothetical protein